MEFDELSHKLIGLAIEVHKHLGPGLLESAYQACFEKELISSKIRYEKEKKVDIDYKGSEVNSAFRADFIIDNRLILEIKSVAAFTDIHAAQLLTYMKLTGISTGLLINFNVKYLKNGIKRYVL